MALHYVAGGGIEDNGEFTAGEYGFNLADVQSVEQLNALPDGVKGLVWLDQAEGVTDSFIAEVSAYLGNDKVFGFYLADEPDPTGEWGTLVTPEDLKAESDWIHANFPDAKTFIVMMDMGWSGNPDFSNAYNPENTHIDYFGIDPYPVRSDSGEIDYDMIERTVQAAVDAGVPIDKIIPVYQAFGGGDWSTDTGGSYVMPTAEQAQEIIDRWAEIVPNPAFDYTYHWSSQEGDEALQDSSELLDVFQQHNLSDTTDPQSVPADKGADLTVPDSSHDGAADSGDTTTDTSSDTVTGSDGSTDTSSDTTTDTSTDTGTDTSSDTATDTSTDTGTDTSSNTDTSSGDDDVADRGGGRGSHWKDLLQNSDWNWDDLREVSSSSQDLSDSSDWSWKDLRSSVGQKWETATGDADRTVEDSTVTTDTVDHHVPHGHDHWLYH
jgi:hypothetical protein